METEIPMDTEPKGQEKALQTTLILEKLFTFFDISDLKSCRGVSRNWSYFATPLLFQRSWVSLMSDEGHWNDLSRFMKHLENNPSLKSLRKIRFKYMNLTDKNNERTRVVEFFERHGKTLKGLHLKRCCLDKGGDFWTNLVRISKWTDVLQELVLEENCYVQRDTPPDEWGLPSRHKIRTLRFTSDKSEGAMPCNPRDIWREFPFLETLQLVDLTEDDNLLLLETMNPGKLKNSKPPLRLRDLDIFGEKDYSVRELPRNQLKMFCELKIPLTKLTIDIGENILAGNFQQLLLAYGPTLKELIIWRGLLANKIKSPGFPFGVTLPLLEFLEVPESCLINFNFIYNFPKLLQLVIRQCDLNPISYETDLFSFRYSYKEWRPFIRDPHRVLQQLKIEFKISEENLEFLRGIFPNLKIFSGFTSQEIETMIF